MFLWNVSDTTFAVAPVRAAGFFFAEKKKGKKENSVVFFTSVNIHMIHVKYHLLKVYWRNAVK